MGSKSVLIYFLLATVFLLIFAHISFAYYEDWQFVKKITIQNTNSVDLTDYQVKIELNSSNFDFSHANSDGSDIRFSAETWWNSSWKYKKTIEIHENSGSDLTDYQIAINISYDPEMNSDFSDLRFTYFNSTDDIETEIPYWIENKIDSNWAYVWIKVPYILANGNSTVYLYYGNADAVDESNGSKVFEFFDDFSSNSISEYNISCFSYGGNCNPSSDVYVNNGFLVLHFNDNVYNVKKILDISDNVSLYIRAKTDTNYNNQGSSFGFQNLDGTVSVYGWRTNWDNNTWGIHEHIQPDDYYNSSLEVVDVQWHSAMLSKNSIETFFYLDRVLKTYFRLNGDHSNDNTISVFRNGADSYEGYAYVDYVFVKKFSTKEPSVSILDEDNRGVEIPYWIESWNSSNQEATVWVKVPRIPANGNATIYMYYGNPTVQSASNGTAVFDQIENWKYGWKKYQSGSCTGPAGWEKIEYDDSLWDNISDVSVDFWPPCDYCDMYIRRRLIVTKVESSIIYVTSDDGDWVYAGDGGYVGHSGGGCHAPGAVSGYWNITDYLRKGENVIAIHCSEAGGAETCEVISWNIPNSYERKYAPTEPIVYMGKETLQEPEKYLKRELLGRRQDFSKITVVNGNAYNILKINVTNTALYSYNFSSVSCMGMEGWYCRGFADILESGDSSSGWYPSLGGVSVSLSNEGKVGDSINLTYSNTISEFTKSIDMNISQFSNGNLYFWVYVNNDTSISNLWVQLKYDDANLLQCEANNLKEGWNFVNVPLSSCTGSLPSEIKYLKVVLNPSSDNWILLDDWLIYDESLGKYYVGNLSNGESKIIYQLGYKPNVITTVSGANNDWRQDDSKQTIAGGKAYIEGNVKIQNSDNIKYENITLPQDQSDQFRNGWVCGYPKIESININPSSEWISSDWPIKCEKDKVIQIENPANDWISINATANGMAWIKGNAVYKNTDPDINYRDVVINQTSYNSTLERNGWSCSIYGNFSLDFNPNTENVTSEYPVVCSKDMIITKLEYSWEQDGSANVSYQKIKKKIKLKNSDPEIIFNNIYWNSTPDSQCWSNSNLSGVFSNLQPNQEDFVYSYQYGDCINETYSDWMQDLSKISTLDKQYILKKIKNNANTDLYLNDIGKTVDANSVLSIIDSGQYFTLWKDGSLARTDPNEISNLSVQWLYDSVYVQNPTNITFVVLVDGSNYFDFPYQFSNCIEKNETIEKLSTALVNKTCYGDALEESWSSWSVDSSFQQTTDNQRLVSDLEVRNVLTENYIFSDIKWSNYTDLPNGFHCVVCNGTFDIDSGETKIIHRYSEGDGLIESEGEWRQNEEEPTVAGGMAYVTKQYNITNSIGLPINVSISLSGRQGWDCQSLSNTELDLGSNVFNYAVNCSKENVITKSEGEWLQDNSRISTLDEQWIEKTVELNNTDDLVDYSSVVLNISIPNGFSCTNCGNIDIGHSESKNYTLDANGSAIEYERYNWTGLVADVSTGYGAVYSGYYLNNTANILFTLNVTQPQYPSGNWTCEYNNTIEIDKDASYSYPVGYPVGYCYKNDVIEIAGDSQSVPNSTVNPQLWVNTNAHPVNRLYLIKNYTINNTVPYDFVILINMTELVNGSEESYIDYIGGNEIATYEIPYSIPAPVATEYESVLGGKYHKYVNVSCEYGCEELRDLKINVSVNAGWDKYRLLENGIDKSSEYGFTYSNGYVVWSIPHFSDRYFEIEGSNTEENSQGTGSSQTSTYTGVGGGGAIPSVRNLSLSLSSGDLIIEQGKINGVVLYIENTGNEVLKNLKLNIQGYDNWTSNEYSFDLDPGIKKGISITFGGEDVGNYTIKISVYNKNIHRDTELRLSVISNKYEIVEKAKESLVKAGTLISDALGKGIDVSKAKNILDRALNEFKSGNYNKTIELVSEIPNALENKKSPISGLFSVFSNIPSSELGIGISLFLVLLAVIGVFFRVWKG